MSQSLQPPPIIDTKPGLWFSRLPVLALLLGILSPVILLLTNQPPPEGVQSVYIIKVILFWLLSSVILFSALYLIVDIIYRLVIAPNAGKAFAGFASVILLLGCSCTTFFWEGTGAGFFEEDAVATQNASYRLISIGDSDGFLNYALCACDRAAFQCTCHHIHSNVYGEETPGLTLNEGQGSINAHFTNELTCTYDLPLPFKGQQSSYWGYYYSECRQP